MKLVERPALVERLRAAVDGHALTMLAAPLGSGKSTALTLAFGTAAGFARLDVEHWHRAAIVSALVETVRTVRADFGRATLGALTTGVPPEALGRTFALDLRHVDAPLLIALDNAQGLYDDPAFGSFLRAVLAERPQSVRLLVAGRTTPEFDLVEAVARRQATIVGYDAFRFTGDEIDALAHSIGRELDPREIEAIASATDGWAAAVVIALAADADGLPVLRSPDASAAYLEAALLPTLPPKALAFLETTSVFETLDLRILERSAVWADARTLLTALVRRGALVFELRESGRYKVHPILRELAARRLEARGGLTAAHAAAVDIYVAGGAMAAALYHVVAAGDPAVAAGFLRAHALEAIGTGDRAGVRAAAALLSEDGGDADVAAFVRGLDQKAAGSPDARDSFDRAATAAARTGDASISFFARTQIVESDLGHLRRVDDGELAALRAAADDLGPAAVATAEMLRGWAEAIGFDFASARARVAPLVRSGDAGARFNIGILHAYVQTALGECDAAQRTLDELIALLENSDRVVLQALALVWFARLAVAWGTTTAAFDAALHAERLAAGLDFRTEEAALLGVLAELATHRGDARAAIAYAERARDRAASAWYVVDVARIRTFAEIAAARAAFLGHENAIARSLALRVAETSGVPAPLRALALAEAAMYTLFADPPAAAAAIRAARTAARDARPADIGDAVALGTADDLLAFLAAANGETPGERYPQPGPFDALIAARGGLVTLELAGIAVGNARRGRGSAEAVAVAFERVTRNGPRFEARLARVYASRYVQAAKPPSHPRLAVDLTVREREILTLLVDGLTNKEIAQRISVSPRTVETHVERVLGKLEVGSRSRAIAKTLRLGLVDLEPLAANP